MQAQNSAEGKKSKKDCQYTAPPPRSKPGSLRIAKKFIDLLLDHNVSSLRSLASRHDERDSGMTLMMKQGHPPPSLFLAAPQHIFNPDLHFDLTPVIPSYYFALGLE